MLMMPLLMGSIIRNTKINVSPGSTLLEANAVDLQEIGEVVLRIGTKLKARIPPT